MNYRLRATWLTPEVIRATARLIQLDERLTNAQTASLVDEAMATQGTVVLIELDPNEGSGVLPLEWLATLGPRRREGAIVRGASVPSLKTVRALSGGFRRDYAYDIFWMVFPLRDENGQPLFGIADEDAELTVRIHSQEEQVSWSIPEGVVPKP
ncbi:MAG: hypothetical protein AB7F99_10665 [Vicinamibacterales bacterium]